MTETKSMTLRLPADLAAELEAVAAVDGQPIAEVVRVAIDAFLCQRKADPLFQLAVAAWVERLQRLAQPFLPDPRTRHTGQLTDTPTMTTLKETHA